MNERIGPVYTLVSMALAYFTVVGAVSPYCRKEDIEGRIRVVKVPMEDDGSGEDPI